MFGLINDSFKVYDDRASTFLLYKKAAANEYFHLRQYRNNVLRQA